MRQKDAQNNAQNLRKTLDEVVSERDRLEQVLPTVVEYGERERMYQRVGELTAFERETRARLVRAIEDLEQGDEEESLIREEVVSEDIARVVERWTGIAVQRLLGTESEKLANLESRLGDRVIGQAEAISAVSRAVRRARSGLADPTQPSGSFLFWDRPVSVKPVLRRWLRICLTTKNLIPGGMSEYSERHSVSRLIGAPPGTWVMILAVN